MNRLTIYFTSDTHGYLFNTNFASWEPRDQGLLGFAFPKDGNTLVIDGGDTVQGSPLTVFCRAEGRRLPVADVMNRLGYDYVTLGNHDFNNGPQWLQDHLSALNARCLCANVRDAAEEMPIFPWAVHTLENGLRVGLVGIVTDWVNLWEKPENLTRLSVTDPFEAAARAVEEVRAQGVDVLVGIYHGGLEIDPDTGRRLTDTNENIGGRLCEALPFDVLLTGHQHIAMAEKRWHGTHIVQTPCNATQAVQVTLDEAGFHSRLMDARRAGSPAEALRRMDASTGQSAPDESKDALAASLEALRADLERWLDRPIGHLSRPLWPGDKLAMAMNGSSIADFFNAVQLWASGADVSCAALPNELRGFDQDVTVRDVVASYVYSNTLVVLKITGAALRQALEQCARYFEVSGDGDVRIARAFLEPKAAHFNYDYFSGVEVTYDLTRPEGRRVAQLRWKKGWGAAACHRPDGERVADDDAFTLVMCDYRATGAGDFGMYPPCPRVKEIQTEVSELIIQYLMAHPEVEVPAEHPIQCLRP